MRKEKEQGYQWNQDRLPKRLEQAMKRKKITQNVLAEKVGVSRQAISSYVTGRSRPELEQLALIAQALEVSTDYLLGLTDKDSYSSDDIQRAAAMLGLQSSSIVFMEQKQKSPDFKKHLRAINFMLKENTFPLIEMIYNYIKADFYHCNKIDPVTDEETTFIPYNDIPLLHFFGKQKEDDCYMRIDGDFFENHLKYEIMMMIQSIKLSEQYSAKASTTD